jgi:RimJ/RimL family protein N-acetyltransferase
MYSSEPSAMTIPMLETERLRLRAPCGEDLDEWAAIMADPDVAR